MWKALGLNAFPLTIRASLLAWRVLLQQASQAALSHQIRIPIKTLEHLKTRQMGGKGTDVDRSVY